jgi:putative hemolysin
LTATQGSTQKRIIAGPDGRPVKDPNHKLGISKGSIRDVVVEGLAAFAGVLAGMGSNQAITLGSLGYARRMALATTFGVTANPELQATHVARSKDFLDWASGDYFAILLDHDPEPGHPDLTSAQLWEKVCSVMPELRAAGRVVTVSTSSSLYLKATGECLKPASGHHTFVIVRGDVERFKSILAARCWLHGEAFFKLGNPNKKSGVSSLLERFITDLAVFSPERLVYESGCCFEDDSPFEQRRPAPQVFEGDYIDLDSIPDLTPEQQAQADANRQAARDAIRPQQMAGAVEHIAKEQPGIKPAEAQRAAKQRITQCARGHLDPEHVLYLADGRIITAGDIGPEHNRVTLRDPQEPDYRGGAITAIVYCEAPGGWTIHSQAHGGMNYHPVGAKGKGKASSVAEPPMACIVADSLGLPGHGGDADNAMALLQAHYRKVRHKPDRVIVNGPDGISAEDEKFLLDGQAPKVLTGRTGCGKTEVIAQLFKNNRDYLPHQLGLAISITLTGGLAARTDLTPVSSRHAAPAGEALDNAVINIESLHRTAGHSYNATATDECDVAFYRMFAAELGQQSQDLNLQQLRRLAEATEHRFYMQANPSQTGLDAIEHVTGKKPQIIEIIRETGQVADVNVTICEDGFDDELEIPLRGSKTLIDMALAYGQAGKKVVIFAGSVGNLKAAQRIFRSHGVAVTLRDGSYTLGPLAVGFGEAPTSHAALRNVTLICRNAEIGIDLQNDFDAVFLWASPGQTAEDCYQHLSRARALFDGRCKELIINFPNENAKFVSVEHLDPAYHLDDIRGKHDYYLGLLNDSQSAHGDALRVIERGLAALETIHVFLARYRAEAAAGQLFQREYLQQRMEELGWSINSVDPEPACKGDPDFNEVLQGLRRKAVVAKAFVVAKGRDTVGCYSEGRATQIEDSNQSGFVIDGYRQKIKLVAQIPGAPTDDAAWILEHIIDNERQLPQARLLGLYMLGTDVALADELRAYSHLQQGHNIRFGVEHGPMALLRSMESSQTLSLLAVWGAILADSPPFILDMLNGDRTSIHRLEPDIQEFAGLIRQHGDRLNGMARYCLGKSDGFNWDEPDSMAIVNKFLSAFLGLDLVKVGQVRVATERPPTYALAGSKIGAFRKAAAAAKALARTQGQLGNTEARRAAQATRLEAAVTKGKDEASANAQVKLSAIAERQEELVATVKTQRHNLNVETAAAESAWVKVSKQFKEHLDMGSCAAMGWIGRINLIKKRGVNLNQQMLNMLSQFRLTPPEPPPEPPEAAPPGIPPDRWGELKEHIKKGRADGAAALADLKEYVLAAFTPDVWAALEVAA